MPVGTPRISPPKTNGHSSPRPKKMDQRPEVREDDRMTINAASMSALAVNNLLFDRLRMMKGLLDEGPRDIDREARYPERVHLPAYRQMIEREGIAARVNDQEPDETWQSDPEVYETEKQKNTAFEIAVEALQKKQNLWSFCHRLDRVCGWGHYSVGVLGISLNASESLDTMASPLEGIPDSLDLDDYKAGPSRRLAYLRVYDESLIQIEQLEQNEMSPRYGQPVLYTLKTTDPGTVQGTTIRDIRVHWTRVIHLVDDKLTGVWTGTPRLLKVWNYLLNVRKILAGSGEMFWKGGFPGTAFEIDPTIAAQANFDEEARKKFRTEVTAYMEGLQRHIALIGLSAKQLLPNIADPRPHFETQLRAISIAMSIPWRQFMGSEQAQLASQQDKMTRNGFIRRRQEKHAAPNIVRTLIDRLILARVLPFPKGGSYEVKWRDLNTPSDREIADIAAILCQAIGNYGSKNGRSVIPPLELFTLVFKWPLSVAEQVVKALKDQLEKDKQDAAAAGFNPPIAGNPPTAKVAKPVAPPPGAATPPGSSSTTPPPASSRGNGKQTSRSRGRAGKAQAASSSRV